MSLEDKFYPDDGTLLTRFDNYMIKSAGVIGESYQQVTGRDYKDLVSLCYKTSTAGFVVGALCLRGSSLLFGINSLNGIYNPAYTSPLEEQLSLESSGHYSKGRKLLRTITSAVIPYLFLSSYTCLNIPSEKNNSFFEYYDCAGIVESVALIPYVFAEYLTKANIPKPPKKTIFDKAKEFFTQLMAPQPVPQPVPIYHLDNNITSISVL